MKLLICSVFFSTLLAGCATTSEVIPVGKETYRVSAEMGGQFPSWSDVKGLALKKANEFCQSKNMYMVEKDWVTHGSRGWTPLNAELTFTCNKE
ncbi:hypothetical protein [Kangiella sediminilitoris]|uniref:Lipoprotein n=1 Tax=Kangiella sediminilitoris TaxID=1144748 RepID=A0A1B3B9I6_9GAMM|nr:hypothetical protein [Kangiella sediminilitoris]AOE49416.1 hypothetical protein KS2013_692 [Kangiella sediminilitoris]